MTDCTVFNSEEMLVSYFYINVEKHSSKNVMVDEFDKRAGDMMVICGFVKMIEGIITV